MARRTVLFVVALLLALSGTGAVLAYVNGVEDRAVRDQDPVEVLFAKRRIAAGTSGQEASGAGLFTLGKLPRKYVPKDAIADAKVVKDLVAVTDIIEGELILPAKFAARETLKALDVPANRIAMSVELGDPERVAGFLRPGSTVAIFATVDVERPNAAGGLPALPSNPKVVDHKLTRLLLSKVPVLAVGPTTLRKPVEEKAAGKEGGEDDADEEEPVTTALITVALTTADAEKLVQAVQDGEIYFGLVDANGQIGPAQGVDNRTIFR